MHDQNCYLIWNANSLKLVPQRIYTMGRGGNCDIRINDKSISREHCRIQWQGNSIVINDTDSTNGIFVNNRKISKAAVKDGDFITLGQTTISVRIVPRDDETLTPSDTLVMEQKLKMILEEIDDPGLAGKLKEIKRIFERKKRKLSELAYKDGLTGLYNRRFFNKELEKEITRVKRYGTSVSLLLMDLDHFKKLNDTYGHQKGDQVLIDVSDLILKNSRRMDIPCRYGGEEIAVILPQTELSRAVILAEKLRRMIQESTAGKGVEVTVSIGAAGYTPLTDTPETMISEADTQLYKAKNNGRNQVCSAGA